MDVLDLLLRAEADLNARTEWGDNALHYAARRGGPEVMRFLIDKGIEIGKPEVGYLYVPSDKMNCSVHFVNFFLRIPLVYLPHIPVPGCHGKQGELTKTSSPNLPVQFIA